MASPWRISLLSPRQGRAQAAQQGQGAGISLLTFYFKAKTVKSPALAYLHAVQGWRGSLCKARDADDLEQSKGRLLALRLHCKSPCNQPPTAFS